MLGCFRTGEANDPETYVAAITAVLARYPEEVITTVTHPVTGLPSSKGWLPTIKEVSEACQEALRPIAEAQARLKRIKEQLEMRERMERGERPTMEQLKEKYGENFGLTPNEPREIKPFEAPSWQGIASMYQADPGRLKRLMKSELSE